VAAKLKKTYGVASTLVPGGRGEFTIWVDGAKAFDKAVSGAFPSDEEAVAAVEEVRGKG
jgi:predicted Rdx family selenoprotein